MRISKGGHAAQLIAAIAGVLAVAAQAEESQVKTLSKVQVSAAEAGSEITEGTGTYTNPRSSSATGLDLSLRETPQSVTVVTRQRIEDQALMTLDDLATEVTGLTIKSYDSIDTYILSRGFEITSYLVDGLPVTFGRAQPRLSIYDRVDVVRGVAGLLNGSGDPGGAISLVRKHAGGDSHADLTLSYGSWNNLRSLADFGGALNNTGSVRARVMVEYEDRDMFYDAGDSQRLLAYGVLEADLSDSTWLSVGASYERLDQTPDWNGLPRFEDGGDIGLPRSTLLDAGWGNISTRTPEYFLDLRQGLGESWQVRVAARTSQDDGDYLVANRCCEVSRDAPGGLSLFPTWQQRKYEDTSVTAALSGQFVAWGLQHDASVGVSWNENTSYAGGVDSEDVFVIDDVFDFDPHSLARPTFGDHGDWWYKNTIEQQAVYGALHLKASEPLSVILGGRYTKYDDVSSDPSDPSWREAIDDSHFSPYGGVVYDIGRHWSAYVGYSEIFAPQFETGVDGRLPPKDGVAWEAGLKGEWFDGGLNTTFAVFDIRQKNRAQPDVSQPSGACDGSDCYIAVGEVKSQGFEAEIAGSPLPRLNIAAGYTWNDQKYSRDEAQQGEPFNTLAPEHLLRAWGTYRLGGALEAWSFGAGLKGQSAVFAQAGDLRIEQEGYFLADARVELDVAERWSVALNVDNLFDKRYYQTVGYTSWGNFYGEPRSLRLTVRGSW